MTEPPTDSARTLAGCAGGTHHSHDSIPLLIDAKATAALLAVGARTLWTLTKCKSIPSRKIGRAVRYNPDELKAWVTAGCPTTPGAAERVIAAMRKEVRR